MHFWGAEDWSAILTQIGDVSAVGASSPCIAECVDTRISTAARGRFPRTIEPQEPVDLPARHPWTHPVDGQSIAARAFRTVRRADDHLGRGRISPS
jgi:hypothetical protein